MAPDSVSLERARREGGAFVVPPGIRLRLGGADAFRYLNGQITRDLKRLVAGEALTACILTPKGKLCAHLLIHREGDDLIVESNAGVGEALRERLERYLVADDVTITEEKWPGRIHLFGDASTRIKQRIKDGIHDAEASAKGLSCSRLGVPGHDLSYGSPVPAEGLLDPSVVEILRIERGIPAWGRELGAETLPPEAGLDRTSIDYDRGCYPGQEVISRLKSIGRVNRLLCGFRGHSLRPGMRILSDGGKELGVLTSAASLPESPECVALGYLPRGTEGDLSASDPLTGEGTPLSITATFGT
jgi:tRNA-modifying protein YgfZ